MQQLFAMFVNYIWFDMVLVLLQGYYQYLLYALLLAVSAPALYPRSKERHIPGVPIVGVEEPGGIGQAGQNFCTDARSILAEAHQKVCRLSISMPRLFWLSKVQYKSQSPFYVPSRLGERLMIPAKYVEELKNAPVKDVDFVATFFEVSVPRIVCSKSKTSLTKVSKTFASKYTTVGSRSTLHSRVANKDLSRHLGRDH